jgi:hypothetical protein
MVWRILTRNQRSWFLVLLKLGNCTSNSYGELDSRVGSLKLGVKGQNGGYQGGPNGMGHGEYKRETKSLAFLFLFKIREVVLQISIEN